MHPPEETFSLNYNVGEKLLKAIACSPMIRVLLVDDQTLIRRALKLFLAEEDSLEIVGEAECGGVAIKEVEELHPDVVLMDILMPGMGGVEATLANSRLSNKLSSLKSR